MICRKILYVFLLFTLLRTFCIGQRADTYSTVDMPAWTSMLSSENDALNNLFNVSLPTLFRADSATTFKLLAQLQAKIPVSNRYYKARVDCFAAWVNYHYKNYNDIREIVALVRKAVNDAYETNDKLFIAFINWSCGNIMIDSRQLELAVTYKLKAEDIYRETAYPVYYDSINNWAVIGELLFHTGDYDQSISYTKKALDQWKEKSLFANTLKVRYYNTVGQNYEQIGKPDSAIVYFDSSLLFAAATKQSVWTGISSGFKGQVLYSMKEYKKAKPLLELDYSLNKFQEQDIAAKSLQWLARINIAEGKNDSALLKAKDALALIKKADFLHYLQPTRILEMCYFTLGEAYKAVGKADSFYYFNQQYLFLHDSITKVSFESSTKMVQSKIDNENIQRAILLLQNEKQNEAIRRNLLIIAVFFVIALLLLYLKKLKLKQRHRAKLVIREKTIAEKELASAQEQMQLFTGNMIEKSDLIEKLKEQLAHKHLEENRSTIEKLSNYTILTEDDWENFKKMFEKVYPRFFISLKQKAAGITLAEQRMAALIKLNLNARQMSSILGISVDSVHKAKQRLRQRMQAQNEMILEETLAYL